MPDPLADAQQAAPLYYRCTGEGSPTVIMDAGLGDTSDIWSAIEPRIAEVTRVLVYDRAGLGRSKPTSLPRTSARMVAELRNLLDAARIEPPYLLVGHSFGGLNMMLFASLYPNDVAGLVLIDSSHPDQIPRFLALMSEEQAQRYKDSYEGNEEGMTFDARLRSGTEVRDALAIPEVPVTILTAVSPAAAEETPTGNEWEALQLDLARILPNAQLIHVENSGHWIHRDQPGVVAEVLIEQIHMATIAGSRGQPA